MFPRVVKVTTAKLAGFRQEHDVVRRVVGGTWAVSGAGAGVVGRCWCGRAQRERCRGEWCQ